MMKNVLRKQNVLQNAYFIFNSNKAQIKQSWRFTIIYNIILNAYIIDLILRLNQMHVLIYIPHTKLKHMLTVTVRLIIYQN